MNRCRITLEELPEGIHLLPYTLEQQLEEAAARAGKMSVQAVQQKLSAVLRIKESRSGIEVPVHGLEREVPVPCILCCCFAAKEKGSPRRPAPGP